MSRPLTSWQPKPDIYAQADIVNRLIRAGFLVLIALAVFAALVVGQQSRQDACADVVGTASACDDVYPVSR